MSVLLGIALLALISLGSAANNWTSIWQGFDDLTMGVDGVDVSDDRRNVDIVVTFTNQSDHGLRLHVLETGLRLSGRSLTAGSARYDDLLLAPGDEVTLTVANQVDRFDAEYIDERLSAPDDLTWNVSGRVRVSVEDLSEELWLPFRSNLDVQ